MPRNVLSAMPLLATGLHVLLFKSEPADGESWRVKLPLRRPSRASKLPLATTAGFALASGVVFFSSALTVVPGMM